ncbi:MAG: alkaline phosphatase D family protein [Candidatus Sericytochromatia bacterium]|nr:alkaline phosphatase D family protein [Candidatus Sericytochromatia bacterium]
MLDLLHGLATGDLTDASAVLWAWVDKAGPVRVEVRTTDSAPPVAILEGRAGVGPAKWHIAGLAPGTNHTVRIVTADGRASTGRFRTLPHRNAAVPVRFGVTGDWSQDLQPYTAIADVPDRDLDFMVALGDTIYGDEPSLQAKADAVTYADYLGRHREGLTPRHGLDTWQRARAATGLFAMIDDHEVVNDFAGMARVGGVPFARGPRYRAGVGAFEAMMPIAAERWEAGAPGSIGGLPRLCRARRLGRDAMLAMVDGRSFRTAPVAKVKTFDPLGWAGYLLQANRPGRRMLGTAQMNWLKGELRAAERDGVHWKFVLVPVPVQNLGLAGAGDRYEGWPEERMELLRFLRDDGIRHVVFIGADHHGTLVNEVDGSRTLGVLPPDRTPIEILTGPTGVDFILGERLIRATSPILGQQVRARYAKAGMADRDRLMLQLIDTQLRVQGLDPIGLPPELGRLEHGTWGLGHGYTWTEFAVAGPRLTVTVRGVPRYSAADMDRKPETVLKQQSRALARFTLGG